MVKERQFIYTGTSGGKVVACWIIKAVDADLANKEFKWKRDMSDLPYCTWECDELDPKDYID